MSMISLGGRPSPSVPLARSLAGDGHSFSDSLDGVDTAAAAPPELKMSCGNVGNEIGGSFKLGSMSEAEVGERLSVAGGDVAAASAKWSRGVVVCLRAGTAIGALASSYDFRRGGEVVVVVGQGGGGAYE
jgi:hypothetical protein